MRRGLIALGAAGLAGLMTLWFACSGPRQAEHPAPRSQAKSAARVDEARRPDPAALAAPDGAPEPPGAASPKSPNAAARAEAPLLHDGDARQARGAEVWRQIERASRQDLQLLASLERELGHVPPEAQEMIRRRSAGATPAELRAWLGEHGPKELRARLALSRWLTHIEVDGGSGVERAPLSAGDGGVPKMLGTLRKKDAAP